MLQNNQGQVVTLEVYNKVITLYNRHFKKLKHQVKFSIHPEQLTVNSEDSINCLEGIVRDIEVIGSVARLFVKLQDREIIVKNQITKEEGIKRLPRVKEKVRIGFNPEEAVILED